MQRLCKSNHILLYLQRDTTWEKTLNEAVFHILESFVTKQSVERFMGTNQGAFSALLI